MSEVARAAPPKPEDLRWVPHPIRGWVPGSEDKTKTGTFTVYDIIHLPGSDEVTFEKLDEVKLEAKEAKALERCTALGRIVNDFVKLDEFSEGAILHQLKRRYMLNNIYTHTGAILICVNPYQTLNIYSSSIVEQHKNRDPSVEPHVFSVASSAFVRLKEEEKDQAIIISGESGAGKTETAKYVLQFLSVVAGSISGVEKQILKSNPVLEAFGNAKTARNNNSSRFGKWMEVRFHDWKISACSIVKYLLEKSRVVSQAPDERNYHIFYQLCAGLPQGERAEISLGDAECYQYLTRPKTCLFIDDVNDADDFAEVVEALVALKFSFPELAGIWRTLSAILNAGNMEFTSGKDGSRVGDESVALVSKLLQVSSETLSQALRFRTVVAGKEEFLTPLSPIQASEARDALAKGLYGRLFDWLVERINRSLNPVTGGYSIGILDIFGFEIFDTNGFEQFCINYANEKLQQHFTSFIFKQELYEYASEGIDAARIEFADNGLCLELIENILKKIDEEGKVQGSDSTLLEKIHIEYKAKPNRYYQKPLLHWQELFIIHHYAGDVKYDITDFVTKNKDTVHDLLEPLIKLPILDDLSLKKQTTGAAGTLSSSASSASSSAAAAAAAPSFGSFSPRPRTSESTGAAATWSSYPPSSSSSSSTAAGSLSPRPPHRLSSEPPGGAGQSFPASTLSPASSATMTPVSALPPRPGRVSSLSAAKPPPEPQQLARQRTASLERKGAARTLGYQFSNQLVQLMITLNKCDPHFIRCLKPNDTKLPSCFTAMLVLRQMRNAGLFETIRIRKSGYPVRILLEEFVRKYEICVKGPQLVAVREAADLQSKARLTLEALKVDSKEIQMGCTKVFMRDAPRTQLGMLRSHRLKFLDEETRILNKMNEAVAGDSSDVCGAAICEGEAFDLKYPEEKDSHHEDFLKAFAEVRARKASLDRLQSGRENIAKAVTARNIGLLQAAIAEGKALGVTAHELGEAVALLTRLEREEEIVQSLDKATQEPVHIGILEQALISALSFSLDVSHKTIVLEAKKVLAIQYRGVIKAAAERRDETACGALISTLKRFGLDDLIAEAKAAVVPLFQDFIDAAIRASDEMKIEHELLPKATSYGFNSQISACKAYLAQCENQRQEAVRRVSVAAEQVKRMEALLTLKKQLVEWDVQWAAIWLFLEGFCSRQECAKDKMQTCSPPGSEVDLLQPAKCQFCGNFSVILTIAKVKSGIKFSVQYQYGTEQLKTKDFVTQDESSETNCEVLSIPADTVKELSLQVFRLTLLPGENSASRSTSIGKRSTVSDTLSYPDRPSRKQPKFKPLPTLVERNTLTPNPITSPFSPTSTSNSTSSSSSSSSSSSPQQVPEADSVQLADQAQVSKMIALRHQHSQEKIKAAEEAKMTEVPHQHSQEKVKAAEEAKKGPKSKRSSVSKVRVISRRAALTQSRPMFEELKKLFTLTGGAIPLETQHKLQELTRELGSECIPADEGKIFDSAEQNCHALLTSAIPLAEKLKIVDSFLQIDPIPNADKTEQKEGPPPWQQDYGDEEILIGSGAFSLVRLVVHKKSKTRYAMKEIDKAKQRHFPLLDTIKNTSLFKHRSIVPTTAVLETDTHWFVIMAYYKAGDLKSQLYSMSRTNAGLSERVVCDWIKCVVQALEHLHSAGVAHLDIKPENILYDDKAQTVLLSDFGLSRKIDPKTPPAGWAGSPAYMSPEMELAKAGKPTRWGISTDMWSLGITMLELMTGTTDRGHLKHINCPLSASAKDLIERLLRLEPAHRPTAKAVLQHKWFKEATHNITRTAENLSTYFSFNNLSEIKKEVIQRLVECRALKKQQGRQDAEQVFHRVQKRATAALEVMYQVMEDALPPAPTDFGPLEWPIVNVAAEEELQQPYNDPNRLLSAAAKHETTFKTDVHLDLPPAVDVHMNVKGRARTVAKGALKGVGSVLDPLRCCLSCPTWEDIAKVNANFSTSPHFTIVRKKNDLMKPPYQLLINVRYGTGGKALVCEIQLVLREIYKLRKQTENHLFYEIHRCEFKDLDSLDGIELKGIKQKLPWEISRVIKTTAQAKPPSGHQSGEAIGRSNSGKISPPLPLGPQNSGGKNSGGKAPATLLLPTRQNSVKSGHGEGQQPSTGQLRREPKNDPPKPADLTETARQTTPPKNDEPKSSAPEPARTTPPPERQLKPANPTEIAGPNKNEKVPAPPPPTNPKPEPETKVNPPPTPSRNPQVTSNTPTGSSAPAAVKPAATNPVGCGGGAKLHAAREQPPAPAQKKTVETPRPGSPRPAESRPSLFALPPAPRVPAPQLPSKPVTNQPTKQPSPAPLEKPPGTPQTPVSQPLSERKTQAETPPPTPKAKQAPSDRAPRTPTGSSMAKSGPSTPKGHPSSSQNRAPEDQTKAEAKTSKGPTPAPSLRSELPKSEGTPKDGPKTPTNLQSSKEHIPNGENKADSSNPKVAESSPHKLDAKSPTSQKPATLPGSQSPGAARLRSAAQEQAGAKATVKLSDAAPTSSTKEQLDPRASKAPDRGTTVHSDSKQPPGSGENAPLSPVPVAAVLPTSAPPPGRGKGNNSPVTHQTAPAEPPAPGANANTATTPPPMPPQTVGGGNANPPNPTVEEIGNC